jgi:osmotically inducible protein OsmC
MSTRTASALWNGTLKEGKGTMKYGAFEGAYSFVSRFETGAGTNPEELVGAAHAGCYSMFLAALLSKEGLTPDSVATTATVELGQDDGPKITSIKLETKAKVSGIDNDAFQKLVATAKEKCPISRLFAGTEISVNATLES